MFTETREFVAESGADLGPATWRLPNGERVLVCQGGKGYSLYTPAEWNNATVCSYTADPQGHVLLHGRYVDYENPQWVVPQDVRERAVDSAEEGD